GIDHEAAVLVLEHGHVLADLAEPAERNDAKERTWHRRSVSPAECLPGPALSCAQMPSSCEITLYGDDLPPECRQNVPMRINSRHPIVARLVLCVFAALLLALPSTALARGVKAPTRAFHPAKTHAKAKPKRGHRRHAPQRVVLRP